MAAGAQEQRHHAHLLRTPGHGGLGGFHQTRAHEFEVGQMHLGVRTLAPHLGGHGLGGRGEPLSYFTDEVWMAAAREALRQSLVSLEARPAPAGEMDVLLGPGWPGILLHEAVGHGLEGDFHRKKTSVFTGMQGSRVAAPGVTVLELTPLLHACHTQHHGQPVEECIVPGCDDGDLQHHLQPRPKGGDAPAARAAIPALPPQVTEEPVGTGYANGGLVQKFADGGLVEDDDLEDEYAPPPAIGPTDVSARGRTPMPAARPQEADAVSDALKYGVATLGAPGAVPQPARRARLQAYARGAGAATPAAKPAAQSAPAPQASAAPSAPADAAAAAGASASAASGSK